jgi:hypothetical protein
MKEEIKINQLENKCEHKWSAPVPAKYTYKSENDSTLYTSYDIFISCEKCGEIKKK